MVGCTFDFLEKVFFLKHPNVPYPIFFTLYIDYQWVNLKKKLNIGTLNPEKKIF